MTDILSKPQFEVVDLNTVGNELVVEVGEPYSDVIPGNTKRRADIAVAPPTSHDEFQAISNGRDMSNVNGLHHTTTQTLWGVTGELIEAREEFAIELAKDHIALRGLQAGRVISRVGDTTKTFLVLSNERNNSIGATIDADEFLADSQDPEWQARLKVARGYVDELESREQGEDISTREGQHREPEVEAARDAIFKMASAHPGVRWSSREIREAARYGVNPGALGVALDMLEAEGVLVRDGEDRKYSLPVNE